MDKKRVSLLSNITTDLMIAKLRREYDVYTPEGFDTWIQEVLDPASGFYAKKNDAVFVIIDATESRGWTDFSQASDRILEWKRALTALSEKITEIPVFVSTIDIRENRIKGFSERKYSYELENDWYQFIQGLSESKNNFFVFDIKDKIADIGRNNFYSNKMWYISNMPYSRDGLGIIVDELKKALDSVFKARKKIIVLDLDNTLWGGVIGEDGIEGIELSNHKEGERFYDLQRQLLEMKKRGVVLAVASKNNEDEALKAIDEHPYMLLRSDDFVSMKINWNNKAENIKAISSELNLTEGSFIFIDDNPIEREIVSGECPEIEVPDFPEDTTELIVFAERLFNSSLKPLRVLNEDLKKTEMYKLEAKRKQEMSLSLDLDDYISRLEMRVQIHKMQSDELERVTQLCNKTNQFNLTTKRYTSSDIQEINNNDNNDIYVVYSMDKYGDSGLISVIIVKRENDTAYIDTFLMSCRVMGRKLENVIINELVKKLGGVVSSVTGEFIPTAKNAPVKELYDRLGFELAGENDGCKKYKLDIKKYEIKEFPYYKEVSFAD